MAATPATGANDGKPAFAAAAEARAAAAAIPVDSANSDTDALNPDFRTRLGRVINRMHDEFGKDVQLVEGFRTQSRQDFLYDQGRTRPGDVVTWTKSSKHTLGLAADVKIDGSYTDAAGFQQLAQIAAQEGLRTLGAKDPGHIELPTRGGAAAWGTSTDAVNIDDNVSRAIGIALDQGNTPGQSDDTGFGNFNGLLSRVGRAPTSAPSIQMPMMSGGGGMGSGNMSQRGFGNSQKDSTQITDSAKVASVASVASVAQVAQVAQVAHAAGMGQAQPAILGAPISVPTVVGASSDAADKVGRMLDARDSAPIQPLSQVTLNIDNPTGAADQVTIQLRAGTVDTAISLGDPNRADRMSLRVGELQHALEQHGLNATAINVASTASGSGPGWNPRSGSDQGAQNGRTSLNYRDNRQDADGTRQRSRREQQGGRQK
jgi:peptidoglycan L-alanyl-D-glutamate endopeptidase CwlK